MVDTNQESPSLPNTKQARPSSEENIGVYVSSQEFHKLYGDQDFETCGSDKESNCGNYSELKSPTKAHSSLVDTANLLSSGEFGRIVYQQTSDTLLGDWSGGAFIHHVMFQPFLDKDAVQSELGNMNSDTLVNLLNLFLLGVMAFFIPENAIPGGEKKPSV